VACPRAANPFDSAPRPGADPAHHIAMVALADELQRIAAGFTSSDGVRLRLKVGISSGPVAGVVIGQHRRFYCLYGDTVNTASRMCSHADHAIHVSAAVARALADSPPVPPLVRVRSRGRICVKGKGAMETYEAVPLPSAASAAADAAALSAFNTAAAADKNGSTAGVSSREGAGVAGHPEEEEASGPFRIDGTWATFRDPSTEADFLSSRAWEHSRRLGAGLLLHVLVVCCQRAVIAPPEHGRDLAAHGLHSLLAAHRAALAILDTHLALALAACATLAAAAARRPAAAEAHRRLFALIVAGHTAAGVLAVRRLPALFGHLVFLPAGHACLAGCLLVFPLRALAPLVAVALAAVAACPILTGCALDPAVPLKLLIFAAGSSLLCRAWDLRERAQWQLHRASRRELRRYSILLADLLPEPLARTRLLAGAVSAAAAAADGERGMPATVAAEGWEAVVMQLDVCGFTGMCEGMAPMAVAGTLHGLFCAFDRAVLEHALFKIDTIGALPSPPSRPTHTQPAHSPPSPPSIPLPPAFCRHKTLLPSRRLYAHKPPP
jgi:class 3 adenylate cyclase